MPHLRQPFEAQLGHIRDTLLMMASLADRNITNAVKALTERDDKLADTVEADDSEIDQLEISVDEMVINYMATHAPVARDCRLMLTASQISINLERVGDQATTIARRARDLNKEPALNAVVDISAMAKIAQGMLRESITAFVDAQVDGVPAIIERDNQVDDLNRATISAMTQEMVGNPATVSRALCILMIAKAIERVADHAKNIAEESYYLHRGEDIRHERNLKRDALATGLDSQA